MSDTTPLYSTTATLVDVPTLAAHQGSEGLLSPSECFAILLIHHDHFKADTEQLSRAGLPSSYDRVSQPSTSRTGLGKLNLKKRLQVQFPRTMILNTKIEIKDDNLTLQGVSDRRNEASKSKLGKRMTLFDMLENDLVRVQTKQTMSTVMQMLFVGKDAHHATLFYPAESVLATPRWAECKGGEYASAPVQWATLSFVSPVEEGSPQELEADAVKRYMESLKNSETDEQVLKRLFVPKEESVKLLNSLLSHLESRGGIWTGAGHVTKPSIKNANPQDRPEFVVIGLFPEPFVSRCQTYYRKAKPLPSELKEGPKSKHAPLITTLTDGERGKADSSAEVKGEDFLEGWTVRISTLEPYRTGSPMEDSSATMFVAGAGGGGL